LVLGREQLDTEVQQLSLNIPAIVTTIQSLALFTRQVQLLHLSVDIKKDGDPAEPVLLAANCLELEKRHREPRQRPPSINRVLVLCHPIAHE
jgi:hypothetical protein